MGLCDGCMRYGCWMSGRFTDREFREVYWLMGGLYIVGLKYRMYSLESRVVFCLRFLSGKCSSLFLGSLSRGFSFLGGNSVGNE